MPQPWEAELPEGVSRLSRLFNNPDNREARMGQGSMYDSRPNSASPRGRPQSASPRYNAAAQPPSPRQRPGSAAIGGRPQSPRAQSPRGSLQDSYGQGQGYAAPASPRGGGARARPQSAAAPSSPRHKLQQSPMAYQGMQYSNFGRLGELEEENDTLRRGYRLAQLEQENNPSPSSYTPTPTPSLSPTPTPNFIPRP